MPDDSPVSRGKFLRSLSSSVTGMALGTGVGVVAQALATKLAAVLPPEPAPATPPGQTPEVVLVVDPFINLGSTEGKRIALTFDDGPVPGVTDRILDELKQRNVPATFFMIGQNVVAHTDLAHRVAAEGHEIGNHTFTHPKLTTLPDQQAILEIQQTQDAIFAATGILPVTFRPPYLDFRRNQAPLAHSRGMSIICGDVNSRDWSRPGEDKIKEVILSQTKAGSIIICHDFVDQTAKCIGEILDKLIEQGFKFSKVSSFIDRRLLGT